MEEKIEEKYTKLKDELQNIIFGIELETCFHIIGDDTINGKYGLELYHNCMKKKIEEKITKKTRAILVVHLHGQPVNMNPVLAVAKKYQIPVIEDAAEAHGGDVVRRDLLSWHKGRHGRAAADPAHRHRPDVDRRPPPGAARADQGVREGDRRVHPTARGPAGPDRPACRRRRSGLG